MTSILHLVSLEMIIGSTGENDGEFDSFSTKKLLKCKDKRLLLVVYARV